jgi:hypothetical protein
VSPKREADGELLFEFRRIGASVKVSAIDPKSGREVSIVGPAAIGEKALVEQAAKKLAYVLAREGSKR